jgi:hypothetical protein
MVSISGGTGRFGPVVIVVERGDATGAFRLFQIVVSYSEFSSIVLVSFR